MLNALHGPYNSVWGLWLVGSSMQRGRPPCGCFFLTWSSVFCALSCLITCWTLSGPEEAILSRSPGTQFLIPNGHPLFPCVHPTLLPLRVHVAVASGVPSLWSPLHLHPACWPSRTVGNSPRSGMPHVTSPSITLSLCIALAWGLF